MGFYIRKSVSVGPFRFNLSKSGIGVSAGIKGLRIGSGPKGNYVQMGRGGVYFRQTLNSSGAPAPADNSSGIALTEIESESASQMVDSSSASLLEEINSKAKKPRVWPWVLGLSVCLVASFVALNFSLGVYLLLAPPCIAFLFMAFRADKLRKTVVLFYELDPQVEKAYNELHSAFAALKGCSRMWHVASRGSVTSTYDWKVNAGASALVQRQEVSADAGSPSYFQCNVSIPLLPAGKQRLYFLPDRILVWDTDGVGAIGYDQLDVNIREQRFIEDGSVPNDAKVVGSTWRYVNKNGGPDGRFSNNRQLAIVLYEEVLLKSQSGLQEAFQLSKLGTAVQISAALRGMASAIGGKQSVEQPVHQSAPSGTRPRTLEEQRNFNLERRVAAAAAQKARDEEAEFISRLSKITCYYRNNEEQVGPVSLWQVHEMIDSGVLPVDVSVIVSGTDFWRPYPEVELRTNPSPEAQRLAAVAKKAAEMQCFFYNGGEVCGPQSLLKIFQLIHSKELPGDVQVCAAGTEKWVSAQDILS